MITFMRSKLIQIKVTEEERERIERLSRSENFSSVSEFIRKMALDRANEKGIK